MGENDGDVNEADVSGRGGARGDAPGDGSGIGPGRASGGDERFAARARSVDDAHRALRASTTPSG